MARDRPEWQQHGYLGGPVHSRYNPASSYPWLVARLGPYEVTALIGEGGVAESQANLARTGVGVGSREGTPKADVSTPDALKRTLLNARSVA